MINRKRRILILTILQIIILLIIIFGGTWFVWFREIRPRLNQQKLREEFFATERPQSDVDSKPKLEKALLIASISISDAPLVVPQIVPEKEDFLLEFPSLGNESCIVRHIRKEEEIGWDYGVPQKMVNKYAVVDYPKLAYPGEEGIVAIGGHYNYPFKNLSKLQTGDRVNIYLKDGTQYSYFVYQKKRLERDDAKTFLTAKYEQELRLITCSGGKSYVVFAYLENSKQILK